MIRHTRAPYTHKPHSRTEHNYEPSSAAPLNPLSIPYPNTIREALRANHEQMVAMLSLKAVGYKLGSDKATIKADALANRNTLKLLLADSLYIHQGISHKETEGVE